MHTDLGWGDERHTTCPHLVDATTCPTPCRLASEATPGEAMRVLVCRWRACAQSTTPISSDTDQPCASSTRQAEAANCQIGGLGLRGREGDGRWEGLAPLLVFLHIVNLPVQDQSKRARICSSCRSRPAAGDAGLRRHKSTLYRLPTAHDDLSRRSAPELPPPEGAHQFRLGWLCVCLLRGPRSVWVLPVCRRLLLRPRCIHDHDHDITLGML